MSNFQIHELNSVPVNRNSNIIHDTEVSNDEWDTGKDTAGAVADLALEVVASMYDDIASYAIGSYCIYGGVLYRCTTATTGVFDVSDWTPVLLTGEYKRVRVMHKADFDLLTPEEQADGMIFVDDVDITADDISYSAGVSVADKIDDMTTYSTNEKAVGTWINGKTIYQKTVSIGALPNNTTIGYEVVGEAIETLVDISVIATDTTGNYFIVLPNLSSNQAFQISFDVEIDNGKTKVFIVTARDVTGYSGVVTIRYTKR